MRKPSPTTPAALPAIAERRARMLGGALEVGDCALAASAAPGGLTTSSREDRRGSGTHRITAGSVRLEIAQVTRKTAVKFESVAASSAPAAAFPSAFASDLAVKYHANAEPIAFSSPVSAMRAFTAGSRSDVESPCIVRSE